MGATRWQQDDGIKPVPYSREVAIAIQVAAASESVKPSARALIQHDIDQFTRDVRKIEDNFRIVQDKLSIIDAKNLDSPFQPVWIEYRLRFHDLLAKSQSIACDIATEAERFGNIILPYVTGRKGYVYNKNSCMEEVDAYLTENSEMQEQTNSLSQSYTALSQDINKFAIGFGQFAEEHRKSISQEYNNLEREIAEANQTMKAMNLQLALLIGSLAAAAVGSIALCLVFPAFIAPIASAGFAGGSALAQQIYTSIQERRAAKNQLNAKQEEAKRWSSRRGEIEYARQELKAIAEYEISNIRNGLLMLSEFWKSLYDDARQVATFLKQTKSQFRDYEDDPEAPIVIVSYLKNGNSIYVGMSQALRGYAMGVTRAAIA